MDDTTLLPGGSQATQEGAKHTRSLYDICQRLTEGRAARGKRSELAALLTMLVLAKLSGMKSVLAAGDWIADQQERLCTQFHLSWKRMPNELRNEMIPREQ